MESPVENGSGDAVKNVSHESTEESSASLKKKPTTGLYFSDIPKDVRVSEFKNVLRERNVKLVFVKWKAFKQSAIVFFEDELDVVMKNLEGLTLQEEPVKFEEIVPRPGGRDPSKRPPKNRKTGEKETGAGAKEKEEGGRKKSESKEVEGEKARRKTNRKEQRMKKREDFGGKFGIFVGKIPKGVTREDLGHEFAKLNVPVPDYVDWVVKKGHAFAFWQEPDSKLSLEVFTGISVAGVTLQVELYDTNRLRAKEERRKEEDSVKREGKEQTPWKAASDLPKKSPKLKKSEMDKKEAKIESQTEKPSVAGKAKTEKNVDVKLTPRTPKKTVTPKGKDIDDQINKVKTPEKGATDEASKAKKLPSKAPETPAKTKAPKTPSDAPKSGMKSSGKGGAKSPTPSSKTGSSAPTGDGKDGCSIS